MASRGDRPELVQLLLAAGADVNAVNVVRPTAPPAAPQSVFRFLRVYCLAVLMSTRSLQWGETPLFTASAEGDPQVVQLLLAAEADVNATDKVRPTAPPSAVS